MTLYLRMLSDEKLSRAALLGTILAASLTTACTGTSMPGGGGGGGGDDDDDDAPRGPDAGPIDGLGPWTGKDNVPWSQDPPFGLRPDQVPQFVSIGWDDNAYSGLEGSNGTGGFSWSVDMARDRKNADGSPVRFTYFLTCIYGAAWQSESPTYVKRAWHQAMADGHELGNHTQAHNHGDGFDAAQWGAEIQSCIDFVTKPFDPNEVNFSPDDTKGIGQPRDQIFGFRTPFLEYNDATFEVLLEKGFQYDVSIEEGWQPDIDGRSMPWPFTLDKGSPGNDLLATWELTPPKEPLTPRPGLWELSVHPVIVPPDEECAKYGLDYSLRAKMDALHSWFDETSGKITGLDYNLLVQFKLTKAELLAVLKYTLDQRLAGNRAPFVFGAHTDIFSSKYTAAPATTVRERQEAIEEFIDYATSKSEVRVVTNKQILDWVRNPVPL